MIKSDLEFSKKLITWYLENKRAMPWRNTKEAYAVWLSEIILQQTRVAQGLPYYNRFIAAFPTIYNLANAPQEQVLKLWQGLGYYSRARNLHTTAQHIVFNLNGKFPQTYTELLSLKGVGDYTASAIASICFNEPTAVVDGNVFRVLSRYFGIELPINLASGKKNFKKLAQLLIDKKMPGTYNQAIMEFGARYCVPVNPNCKNCIFSNSCWALQNNKVNTLPVKLKKAKIKKRHFNYLAFFSEDNKTIFQKRVKKDIWQHLYEFPLIETTKTLTSTALQKEKIFINLTKGQTINSIARFNTKPIIHKLSHQHLSTTFWVIETTLLQREDVISIDEIHQYPVPTLIENFLNLFLKN